MKIPKSDTETMSPLETKEAKVSHSSMNTPVGKASEKEEQKNDLCNSDDSEFFEDDSDDDTIDITVTKTLYIKKPCL